MKNKKKVQNTKNAERGIRLSALALIPPLLAALTLVSCRRAEPDDKHSLVVGVDILTDDATTAPDPVSIPESDTSPASPDSSSPITESSPVTQKPQTEETTEIVDVVSYEYDVVLSELKLADVGSQQSRRILRYPKLTGLSNESMQTKINELLEEIALSEFKNRLLGLEEYTKSGVAVTYEITSSQVTYLGGNLLSVRSEGGISYSDGADTVRFVYANTINLNTGKNLSQKKLYSDFEGLKRLFEAGAFKQISGADNITSSISLADMMSQYSLWELYNTYPVTYFTSTELIISVELTSKLGGFAEFSLPLTTADAYLGISPTK